MSFKYAYALDLKNQYTAAEANDNLFHLSEKTTRDTTAVKWITYLTVIYVPGSFISVSCSIRICSFSRSPC